jgi:hypothetical protein
MKQLLISLLFVLAIFDLSAQKDKNTTNENSMLPIIKGLTETVSTLEKEGVRVIHIEFDNISKRKKNYFRLEDKYTYGIMAYGDYRVKEIVVNLFKKEKNEWKKVAFGEKSGNSSILHFEPTEIDDFLIEIEIKEYFEGYSESNYGMILIHN